MNSDNSEVLNNLIQSIKEKMDNSNNVNVSLNNDNNNSTNISSLLQSLNTNSNTNNNESNNESSNPFSSIDPSIFLKIQQIMSSMNSNNPQKELLLSLKPFLRKSRQDKISEYITILSVISILEGFKNKGSD